MTKELKEVRAELEQAKGDMATLEANAVEFIDKTNLEIDSLKSKLKIFYSYHGCCLDYFYFDWIPP